VDGNDSILCPTVNSVVSGIEPLDHTIRELERQLYSYHDSGDTNVYLHV
jgi:hypothetical protein